MPDGAIGYATLPIIPSMVGFGPALAAGTAPPAVAAGKGAGLGFTAGFMSMLGPAVIVGAVVGAFKGLYEVGEVMDTVTDGIRVATGAQGAALDGLVQNVQNVGNQIPATLTDIGDAVSNVVQRLGYSGPVLEGFTARLLEVGRLQDAPVNINDLSSALNGFRVPAEQANATLDQLFRVSQSTGIPVAQLSASLANQGAVLGQLGFSLGSSAALLGTLDKAGVNAEQVVKSLSAGMIRLAKDGEAPADAFDRVVGELQGYVDTGQTAAALDLAGQIFGTRGAAQFISALESGQVNIEMLRSGVFLTGDTILGAAAQTRDFSENIQLLQNNLLDRLAPAGDAVFGLFNRGFTALTNFILGLPPLGEIFAPALAVLQPIASVVGGALASAFQTIWAAIGPLVPQLVQLWTTASPVMIIFQALSPLLPQIAGLFTQLVGVLANLAAGVLPILIPVITQLAGIIGSALAVVLPIILELVTALVPIFFSLVDALMPVIVSVLELIGPLLSLLEPLFALIGPILSPLIELLVMLINAGLQPVMLAFQMLLPPILDVVGVIISALFPVIEGIMTTLGGLMDFIIGVFTGDWQRAWNGIVSIFSGIFSTIGSIVRGVMNIAIGVINGVISGINNVTGLISNATGGAISISIPRIPSLATGADIAARRGGTLALLGEAGEAETVSNLGLTNRQLAAATALAERALEQPAGLDPATLLAALRQAIVEAFAAAEINLTDEAAEKIARILAPLVRNDSRQGRPILNG